MSLVVSWMDGTYYRLDWQVAFTQALSKMKFLHSYKIFLPTHSFEHILT